MSLVQTKKNTIVLNVKILNEHTIIVFLIVLMLGTFLIPPISFSELIIAWNQITPLNYVRAITFLIGCAFVPGSCIFNLLFPKSSLHEKFKVEPFLIKIVIYPIISFTFLGSITLISDQLGLIRNAFSPVLFLSIVLLFILNLIVERRRGNSLKILKKTEIAISKYTIFILFLALSIIIIALSIHLETKYFFEVDAYRAISYSTSIGRVETKPTDMFYTYAIYWNYIVYSLSSLSGIPTININVMLLPFLYLFILSLYLLIKTILSNLKEIYAILSTMFVMTFSSLFYFFQNELAHDKVSWFIFEGVFRFRFKSFALILFFISTALFVIAYKTSTSDNINNREKNFLRTEEFKITIISAFFLIQSYMIYFLPVIPAISLIIILITFSTRKKQIFKYYFTFMLSLVLFFVVFDLIANNFFSWITINQLSYFFEFSLVINDPIFSVKLLLTSLFAYTVLFWFLVLNFLFFQIYKMFLAKYKNKNRVISAKFNAKIIFKIIIGIFSTFLILDILLNLIRTIRSLTFFTLFLHLLFYNIGFIGILGIFCAYYLFKMDKRIFYALSVWVLFLFGLATIGIVINWVKYPNLAPTQLPGNTYYRLVHYWFNRIWYYSTIPLSIFSAIGIIKLKKKIKFKNYFQKKYKYKNQILNLSSVSLIIVFSLSNTVLAGMMFNNQSYRMIKDEDAQIAGWVSENIERGSGILIGGGQLRKYLYDITRIKTYLIDDEVKTAIFSDDRYYITSETDGNCSIDYIEKIGNYDNVIDILDNNSLGSASIDMNLFSEIRSASIEFFVKTTNTSKGFWLNSSLSSVFNGFSISIVADSFSYFNGSSYEKIVDVENDKWYQVRIDFECTNNNYSGLDMHQWKISINGTEYGNYDFWNDVSFVNYIELFTSQLDSGWNIHITGLNFSWDSDFKFERYLFKYLKVIDYLKAKNIPYLILSKEPTSFNVEAEKYIDIYGELIPFFYKNKLYEYKSLAIYCSN